MRALTLSALAMFGLDQASKYGVVWGLDLKTRFGIDVFPPLLQFRMGWNEGINFGLLGGAPDLMRWVLVLLALVISGFVLFWVRDDQRPKVQIAAGLMIGGALGNALDRVIHGAVIDFLNMSCCGFDNPYVFNIADVGVFAGALGLAIWVGSASDTQKAP